MLSAQSSYARTAIAGPFIDVKATLPIDTLDGGLGTHYTQWIVYTANLTPVSPLTPCSGSVAPPLVCGTANFSDSVIFSTYSDCPECGFPYRVVAAAFLMYDDTDSSADVHIKTIYGTDLNADGTELLMGGIDASDPPVSFENELFLATDGTGYRAGSVNQVAISDVPAFLGAGYDLSFLQGPADEVVYIFDTTIPAANFPSLATFDPSFAVQGASSVKDGFGVNLPLTLTPATAIEPRSGGKHGSYTVQFAFNNNLASVESATTSCGTVVSKAIDRTDPRLFSVNLRVADCNTQNVAVTLTGIVDEQGNVLDSASTTVGLLIGDVDSDRTVTKTDFSLVKKAIGQTTDSTNFRDDVNANGKIDSNDSKLVKQHLGNTVPEL